MLTPKSEDFYLAHLNGKLNVKWKVGIDNIQSMIISELMKERISAALRTHAANRLIDFLHETQINHALNCLTDAKSESSFKFIAPFLCRVQINPRKSPSLRE